MSSGSPTENVPTDFKDPYYLKHCYVCKADAKPGQEYICNYGGIACFGCRAFWRRAHIKTRTPQFVCREIGNCDMAVRTKRKCQKCRYELCKKIGMTSSAILTEEQKKERFRKSLNKRVNQASEANTESSNDGQSSDVEGGLEDSLQLPKLTKEDLMAKNPAGISMKIESSSRSHAIIEKKVGSISQAYTEALLETSGNAFQDLVFFWRNLSADRSLADLKTSSLPKIIKALQMEFRIFAFKIRHFQALEQRDQEMLLHRNTSLYVQLQMACSLLTFSEQMLAWPPSYLIERLNFLKSIFPEFDVTEYLDHLRILQGMWMLDQSDQRALLSFIILFEFDTGMNFSQVDLLEDLTILSSILFENKIEKMDPDFNTMQLCQSLTKMSQLCGSFDKNEVSRFGSTIGYSETEESWLQEQYRRYDSEFFSIHIGESILKEFLMFSLGEPISKKYFATYASLVIERMKRVLKVHPELDSLPSSIQDSVIKRNTLVGTSMILTRSENFSSGLQQLQYGLTSDDNKWWKDNFGKVFDDTEKIKKLSLRQSVVLSQDQIAAYLQVANIVRNIVLDQDMFRLRVLIVLTKPLDEDSTSDLRSAHNNYLNIFQRRLKWLNFRIAPDKLRESMEASEHFQAVAQMIEYLIQGSK